MNARNFNKVPPVSKLVTPTIKQYKRPTAPTSVPINKLLSNAFPLSIKQSITDYRLRHNIINFQHDLLSLLPFYPEPDNYQRSAEVVITPIDLEGNYINEFVIYPDEETRTHYTNANHLIMVHGYGAGLGFFIKNFSSLTRSKWIIHAIDLLGYGCSSRPRFTPKSVPEVEAWFHDSFETWFAKRQIPKNNTLIMAHSMGAYLMASYGINKDPNFCRKLVMVSPGGIIDHKFKIQIPKYFERLWEHNVSPFSLVRNSHFYGSKLVSGWTYRRFAKLPMNEIELLHKYTYGIFQAPGSGEYMLNYLLKPGASPRLPMINRPIEKLKCETDWWYGTEDWMNIKGGQVCSEKLRAIGISSNVLEIANSGHHIYLDNPKTFNYLLHKNMDSMETS